MTASSLHGLSAASLLAGALGALAAPPSPSQQEPSWVQESPTTRPVERAGHALAYHRGNGRTVLFGGLSTASATLSDTWEWTPFLPASPAPPFHGSWAQRSISGPSARYGHAMVWDNARGLVILFGGRSGSTYNNETWGYNGTAWSQRTPTTRPTARYEHALAYDAVRQRIVLFGGSDGTNHLADTWEYDGTTWTPRFPMAFPPPRRTHAMTFAAGSNRVLLFGGLGVGNVYLDDTWDYDGVVWVRRLPPRSPPARMYPAMDFDVQRGMAVLFGGDGNYQTDDTWEWDGSTWQMRQPPLPRPMARRPVMAYDSYRGRVVLFGGENLGGIRLNDTWEYYFPSGFVPFGEGCAGSAGVPSLAATNTVPCLLGGTLSLQLHNQPAPPIAFAVIGLSRERWGSQPLPMDMAPYGMPGCTLYVSVDTAALMTSTGGYDLPIPANTVLLGFRFYSQALVMDANAGNPMGAVLSNAGTGVIGN